MGFRDEGGAHRARAKKLAVHDSAKMLTRSSRTKESTLAKKDYRLQRQQSSDTGAKECIVS